MTADEAAQAEAESIATRWVPAHMTARQGMVDDIARALVTGRRLVDEALRLVEEARADARDRLQAAKAESDELYRERDACKRTIETLGADLAKSEVEHDNAMESACEVQVRLMDERDRLKDELSIQAVAIQRSHETIDRLKGELAEARRPVPMLIHCPNCLAKHIDVGEFATKVHHTHSCQTCGHTWRPAVAATVGVEFLPGFKNAATPAEQAQPTFTQGDADALAAEMDAADSIAAEQTQGEGALAQLLSSGGHMCGVEDCSNGERCMSETEKLAATVAELAKRVDAHVHCRHCGFVLKPENALVADGCPCNSGRGVNHGLVARHTCTCEQCDPAKTGGTRKPAPPPPEAAVPAVPFTGACKVCRELVSDGREVHRECEAAGPGHAFACGSLCYHDRTTCNDNCACGWCPNKKSDPIHAVPPIPEGK